MPRLQPTMSWQDVRQLMECFTWIDKRTGVRVSGFNPPQKAVGLQRKSCFVKYVTLKGQLECGYVECLKVFLDRHQRMIRFVESGEIRRICDLLIVEVDGIRIISG